MTNPVGIPDNFASVFCAFCARVEADPFDMLGVWMNESGISAKAWNHNGDASGCFQAMPQTLKNLGFHGTSEDFRALSIVDQIPYAEKYYAPARGKLISSAAVYLQTFLPADLACAADPDFVLVHKGGRRGWAFDANAGFDANGDLSITVAELDQAIKRACHGPRWEAISDLVREYMGLQPLPTADRPPTFDLSTVAGVQEALIALGLDVGKSGADNVLGHATRVALEAFQKWDGLEVDGVPGPATRAGLKAALADL